MQHKADAFIITKSEHFTKQDHLGKMQGTNHGAEERGQESLRKRGFRPVCSQPPESREKHGKQGHTLVVIHTRWESERKERGYDRTRSGSEKGKGRRRRER